MEFKVFLKNTKDVEEFVRAASRCDGEIDMTSGAIYLDAKSFLGVLSAGMKREMRVICLSDEPQFFKSVRKFAVASS